MPRKKLEKSDIQELFENLQSTTFEDYQYRIFDTLKPLNFKNSLIALKSFIWKYWEERIPWLNKQGLKEIEEKHENFKKKIDIEKAEYIFDQIQRYINDKLVDSHYVSRKTIDRLKYYIKEYWENFVPWINTKNLDDIQEKLDFKDTEKDLKKAEKYLKNWLGISAKNELNRLIKKLQKYWENFVPWLTFEKITEMGKVCDEVLLKEQIWKVKIFIDKNIGNPEKCHYKIYWFIETWVDDVYFENPWIKLQKGDIVRFRVKQHKTAWPNHKDWYKIEDIVLS